MKKGRIVGRSALEAYRTDLPLGGLAPDAIDGQTVLVATLLRHAVSAAGSIEAGKRISREAYHVARASFDAATLRRGCAFDDGAARAQVDVFRLVAERAQLRGQLTLAENILEAAESLPGISEIAKGRIGFDRARNAMKLGQLDLCVAQLDDLLRRARRLKSPELEARGLLALSGLAQVKGNYGDMRRTGSRGVRIAEKFGHMRLAAGGHAGLGVYHAMRGDFQRGVTHMWRAYNLSTGDLRGQHDLMSNLAHAFLLSGHDRSARAAASYVLQTTPAIRSALPALGSFAVASARLGDAEGVRWAADHVRRLAKSRGHYREMAAALAESGAALVAIGTRGAGEVLQRRAEQLAVKHGFYDMTFRESMLPIKPLLESTYPLSGAAAAAAAEIEALHEDHRQLDVELATAP